jgi:hypothetical protein
MSRHPCGSPMERSRPSRAETRGGRTLLRPATFSRCRQRQSHRRTADPTGAWFPKERPSRGSGGRHRVRWPWLPFGSLGNPRRVFSTRPARARRPRRGTAPARRPSRRCRRGPEAASIPLPARGRAGSPRRISPRSGPAARTRRGRPSDVALRRVRPKHGRAVRGRGARRCGSSRARFASARRRGRRGRGAIRPRPGGVPGTIGGRRLPRQRVLAYRGLPGGEARQPPSVRGRRTAWCGGLEGVTAILLPAVGAAPGTRGCWGRPLWGLGRCDGLPTGVCSVPAEAVVERPLALGPRPARPRCPVVGLSVRRFPVPAVARLPEDCARGCLGHLGRRWITDPLKVVVTSKNAPRSAPLKTLKKRRKKTPI